MDANDAEDVAERSSVEPMDANDAEDVAVAEDRMPKWDPRSLEVELLKLPVSALYPELTKEVVDILSRWHQRFSPKVWKRMVHMDKEAAHCTPRILKEFNESAPVICRVRSWVDTLPAESPSAFVIDLGAGFGFLSMFLAELLPPERTTRCILVDASFPNLGVQGSGENGISTDHIYGSGEWRIPLHTLKIDLKKGRALKLIAEKLLQAPAGPDMLAPAPAIVCGVHLCNTLGLRAAQLFNENPEVVGFALVPCCFPTQKHRVQEVVYQLGSHRFTAEEVLSAKLQPSSSERFASWTGNILDGIDPGEGGTKVLERVRLHRPKLKSMYAQDVYIFAERPWQRILDPKARKDIDSMGAAIIVDAKFGHAASQAKEAQRKAKDSANNDCSEHEIHEGIIQE